MSTASTPLPASTPTSTGVTLARVVRSEWTKLWSLRSTRWALLVSVVGMTRLGLLVSGVQMAHWKQRSAQGIATFAGLMFVLPGITAILPNSWGDSIDPYLPLSAGTDILTIHPDPASLAAWTGFLLFLGYSLGALALSAVLLLRRDA